MNKKLIALLILAAAILVAWVAAPKAQSQEKIVVPETPRQSQALIIGSSPTETLKPAEVKAGVYTPFREALIGEEGSTVLLFFHAEWCPQCRALDQSIIQGTIPNNVIVAKVDYDTNTQLRRRYGITLQTTLIRVNTEGEEVGRYVAYDDPSLAAVLANLL